MRRGTSKPAFTRERARLRNLVFPARRSSSSSSSGDNENQADNPEHLVADGAALNAPGMHGNSDSSEESSSDPANQSSSGQSSGPSEGGNNQHDAVEPLSHSESDVSGVSSAQASPHDDESDSMDVEDSDLEDIEQGIISSGESVSDGAGEEDSDGTEDDDNEESDEDSENDGGEQHEDEREEGDSNSDESDSSDDDGETILYPGSPVTVGQSLLAVLTLALRYSLTGQCIVDILNLIALHCTFTGNCKTTLWKFKKFFRKLGRSVLIFHYFCVGCEELVPSKNTVCPNCNGLSGNSYFIEFPIVRQLETFFLRRNFYEKLQFRFNRNHRDGFIDDIFDGSLYQEHFSNGGLLSNGDNISFTWYSDGIAIFKSSKFSLWPIYLIINELPYKERMKRENMVLLGLYFGIKKPCANLFLTPFRETFETLRDEGVNLRVYGQQEPVRVRALLLCGTCDSPARSLFLRFTQYNGYYGCLKCKSPGGRYTVGKAGVHVHPFDPDVRLRTDEEVPVFARVASQREKPVFGVQGLSLLYFLMPSMIKGMGIDIMHQAFLGVSKMLLKLWFDSSFSGQEFSMSGMLKLVDDRFQKLRPPSYVQRLPRSIEKHFKYWKAQELKLWLLYYSIPCLSGLMPDEYYNHHLKLVSGLYLLSMDSISMEQIDAASVLLVQYVRDFARLYGLRYLGMNVHMLLHLPQCVREIGPLWAYSCFKMEDLNGKLSSLIHGTRYAALQVSSGASALLNLPIMINALPANSKVRLYCENMMSPHKRLWKIAEHIDHKTRVVGTYKGLPVNIRNTVEVSLGLVRGHYQQFFRLQMKGALICSRNYTRPNKKLSCFVSAIVNNRHLLCEVTHFVRWSNCNCTRKCLCEEGCKFFGVAIEYERQAWRAMEVPNVRLNFMSRVSRTDNISVFEISSIQHLCFYLTVADREFICEPINTLEVE